MRRKRHRSSTSPPSPHQCVVIFCRIDIVGDAGCNRGCRGGGRSIDEDNDKDEDGGGGARLCASSTTHCRGRTRHRSHREGGVVHCGGRIALYRPSSRFRRPRGWAEGGCDTDVDDDDELDKIVVDRARTADRYLAATAQRTRQRHGPSNEDYGALEAAQGGDKNYSSLSKVVIISDYKSQYSSSDATVAHPPTAPPHASQLIQNARRRWIAFLLDIVIIASTRPPRASSSNPPPTDVMRINVAGRQS